MFHKSLGWGIVGVVVCVAAGCNTFSGPEPFGGESADAGGTVDSGTIDVGMAGDASVDADASTESDAGDAGDAGVSGPSAVIEDECSGFARTAKIEMRPSGDFLPEISITTGNGIEGPEYWVTYLERALEEPSDARVLIVGFGSGDVLTVDEIGNESIESFPAANLEDFATSGASMALGQNFESLRWAFTGTNCEEGGTGTRPVVFYGGVSVTGTVVDEKSIDGECRENKTSPQYWAPHFVGGFSPLLQTVEVTSRLVLLGEAGIAVDVDDAGSLEEVEWDTRPSFQVASVSPTAGHLLLTLNTSSSLFVWDTRSLDRPVAVTDRISPDAGFGLGADMIYLGDSKYLLAYAQSGEIWIDIFSWDFAAGDFSFAESVDRVTPEREVVAVDLAPYEGGWVLGWVEDTIGEPIHQVIPYRWDGTTVTRTACSATGEPGQGFLDDYELAARKIGGTLEVISVSNQVVPTEGSDELELFGVSVDGFF